MTFKIILINTEAAPLARVGRFSLHANRVVLWLQSRAFINVEHCFHGSGSIVS